MGKKGPGSNEEAGLPRQNRSLRLASLHQIASVRPAARLPVRSELAGASQSSTQLIRCWVDRSLLQNRSTRAPSSSFGALGLA